MRPVRGLVVDVVKTHLTIELENGTIIHYRKSGIEMYDRVLVYYNFQNLKVTGVELESVCVPGICHHQFHIASGSGALRTGSDGVPVPGFSGPDYEG